MSNKTIYGRVDKKKKNYIKISKKGFYKKNDKLIKMNLVLGMSILINFKVNKTNQTKQNSNFKTI